VKRLLGGFLSLLFFAFFYSAFSKDIDYKFGRGLKFKDFVLGGYSAFIYEYSDNYKKFNFEELALLGFWNITQKVKLFSEVEFKDIYVSSSNKQEEKGFSLKKVELNRLYIDYIQSDYLKFRYGRFITPLGYWNPVYVTLTD